VHYNAAIIARRKAVPRAEPSGLIPYAPPKLRFGARDAMNIDDSQLQCLAYLCADRGFGPERVRTPIATCFSVQVENEEIHMFWAYLVTARHTIEKEDSDVLYVRFNRKSGGTIDVAVHREDWVHHDSADVSAILMPGEAYLTDVQYFPIPTKWFVGPGPEYRYTGPENPDPNGLRPLVGDEICAMGLFVQDFGTESNLPVTRFGRISRMPSAMKIEKYDGDQSRSVAWLVELLSWGGVSGSPVLWGRETFRSEKKPHTGELLDVRKGCLITLLGLVHGHFHKAEKASVKGDVFGEIRTNMNTGLAIVTPACAIVELLNQNHFVKIREHCVKEYKAGRVNPITSDSGRKAAD
jgi:hypothetical protein